MLSQSEYDLLLPKAIDAIFWQNSYPSVLIRPKNTEVLKENVQLGLGVQKPRVF